MLSFYVDISINEFNSHYNIWEIFNGVAGGREIRKSYFSFKLSFWNGLYATKDVCFQMLWKDVAEAIVNSFKCIHKKNN